MEVCSLIEVEGSGWNGKMSYADCLKHMQVVR